MKKLIYTLIGFALFFAACNKNKEIVENTKYEKLEIGDSKYTYLKFLNLSQGSPIVNYYLNGSKFSARLSSTGVENGGYTFSQIFPGSGNYAAAAPGQYQVSAKIIPTAATDPNLEVFNNSTSFAGGKNYSIYFYNKYNVSAKKIPAYVVYEDVRPTLDTTSVLVRLASFGTNAPSFDLSVGTTYIAPIVKNVTPGKISDWARLANLGPGIDIALKAYLTISGQSAPVIAAGNDLTLSKGRAYTVYIFDTPTNGVFTIGSETTFQLR